MNQFVITATGTGIGKTIFAAALADALGAAYWKPVQAGLADETDSEVVARLSGATIFPEAYRLTQPLSPHRAAELDGVEIDIETLRRIRGDGQLIVEGAGGVLVPLTRDTLTADLFAHWQIPVVIVATTTLGTISHSLTAIEALKSRGVPIHGIAFVGDANEDNEATIAALSGVRRLGRLPIVNPLTRETLAAAFAAHFCIEDFT